jgi:hypothetical protein
MRSLSAYVNLVAALAPKFPDGGTVMAKNKNNRDRKQSPSERTQQADRPAAQSRDEQLAPPLANTDTAVRGKRQKRFGHN